MLLKSIKRNARVSEIIQSCVVVTTITKRKEDEMNREFLKELGLEKEQVDSVMAEYGKEIGELNAEIESRDKQLETLEIYKEETKGYQERFEELSKDKDDALTEANEWQAKFEKATNDNIKIVNDTKLDLALSNIRTHDKSVLKSLIDYDDLTFNDDGIDGLEKQLEGLKADKPYLFVEEEQAPKTKGEPLPKGIGTNKDETSRQVELGKKLASKNKVEKNDNNPFI